MSSDERIDFGKAAYAWWLELQPDAERGRRGDTATLAALRRAGTPSEAITVNATIDLALSLGVDRRDWESVAILAAVLAHVRTAAFGEGSVARALGHRTGEQRLMSELRFRQLLQADTAEERMAAFRRAVAMLGGRANIHDLAESLLDWSDPGRGETRRVRWMFDYFGEPAPGDATAPTAETELEETE